MLYICIIKYNKIWILMDVVYRLPNDETLAAMKEAKEGRNLEKLNLETLGDYVKSLE